METKDFIKAMESKHNIYLNGSKSKEKLKKEIICALKSKSNIKDRMEYLIPKYMAFYAKETKYLRQKDISNGIEKIINNALKEYEDVIIAEEDKEKQWSGLCDDMIQAIEMGAYSVVAHDFTIMFMCNLF